MLIQFLAIMFGTFLTCLIYFYAALAAVSAVTVHVEKDERRASR